MKYNKISLNEPVKDERGYFIGYFGIIKKDGNNYDINHGRKIGNAIIDDSKDDILNVEINLEDVMNEYEKLNFIKAFINTIKLYFSRKELIRLTINNETHNISNKETKEAIEQVLKEKKNTEAELSNWNALVTEEFEKEDSHSYEYDEFVDKELFNKIESSEETIPEVFIKNKSITWYIDTNNCFRKIIFNRDGLIELYKSNIKCDNSYNIIYNSVKEEIIIPKNNDNSITIKNNLINISEKSEDEKFSLTHFNNSKKITFTKQINKDSSILLEIIEDKEGNIKKCNIDFRTHKGNKKINGVYALRITPGNRGVSLKSIDRHGFQTLDFSGLLNIDSDVLNQIKNGNISNQIIEDIINVTIPVINEMSLKLKRKHIPHNYGMISVDGIRNKEIDSLKYIKHIRDEIPIKTVRDIIRKTENNYDRKSTKTKKKVK